MSVKQIKPSTKCYLAHCLQANSSEHIHTSSSQFLPWISLYAILVPNPIIPDFLLFQPTDLAHTVLHVDTSRDFVGSQHSFLVPDAKRAKNYNLHLVWSCHLCTGDVVCTEDLTVFLGPQYIKTMFLFKGFTDHSFPNSGAAQAKHSLCSLSFI